MTKIHPCKPVRFSYILLLTIPVCLLPRAISAQSETTAVLASANALHLKQQSQYYHNGFIQWSEQARYATAVGNPLAAAAANHRALAWFEAKQVAELAELKSGFVGREVKALPMPGTADSHPNVPKISGIRLSGPLDPAVNIHNSGNEHPIAGLYKDYMYAMRFWYDEATVAKSSNDTVDVQTAVRNAEAFEAAYLSIKGAELKAKSAGIILEVTPVPGLPSYPSGAQQQSVLESAAPANSSSGSASVPPMPTPVRSTSTGLTKAREFAQAPIPAYSSSHAASDDKVTELSDQSFTDTTQVGTWVVEFGAPWCAPCKAMKPILHDLASELGARVSFATIDIEQHPLVAKRYKVEDLPTFMLIKNGAVVATTFGGLNKQELTAFATR